MEARRLGHSKGIAILDTSALLLFAEGLASIDDLLDELGVSRLAVPDVVVFELQKIALETSKRGRCAQWVLNNILPMLDLVVTGRRDKPVDRVLTEVAKEMRCILVTADTELAKRAQRSGVRVAVYRSAKRRFELLSY